MTGAMLWFATVLCALAGGLLAAMAIHGKPSRGEALVGAHLATGPMALAFVAGCALMVVAAPLPSTVALVALGVCAPGLVITATMAPLAAYGGRRAALAKLAVGVLVAAPFAVGHGGALHASLPWAGATSLALAGIGGTALLLESPFRRLRGRLAARFGAAAREPSAWELEQAQWQRGEWAKLSADAPVAALLGHARSLAPDVRDACHARLAAHADLDRALTAQLAAGEPGEALWYLAHHYPRSRAPFAAAIGALLANLRTTWPARMRDDPHPRPWTGDLLPALECALAVLSAGGDVRSELRAWQAELAAMPKFAGLAKDLARNLAKAG
jgi:hypothetical protein